mgnify:FL=1|jgi:hypothetical protein
MAKISTYPVVAPEGSDIIVGSDTGSSNSTKNFTAQSVADLYVEVPNTLQEVLDAGNSATQDIALDGDMELNRLSFLDGPAVADVGQMAWNSTDGTVDLILMGGNVTLQIGQEQVTRVVNKSGVNLTQAGYQAVKILGAQGNRLSVSRAMADSDANSADTLGIVTENISNNSQGYITSSGLVRDINTTGALQGESWMEGDVLYLSPTVMGGITNVKPIAPQHTVIVGFVVNSNPNNGSIYVKVDNGYEIDELHNVRIATATNGQLLRYNSALSVWENWTSDYIVEGQVGSVGAEPAQAAPVLVASVFTNGDPAIVLGQPDAWVEINIEGTTYKFPAYS